MSHFGQNQRSTSLIHQIHPVNWAAACFLRPLTVALQWIRNDNSRHQVRTPWVVSSFLNEKVEHKLLYYIYIRQNEYIHKQYNIKYSWIFNNDNYCELVELIPPPPVIPSKLPEPTKNTHKNTQNVTLSYWYIAISCLTVKTRQPLNLDCGVMTDRKRHHDGSQCHSVNDWDYLASSRIQGPHVFPLETIIVRKAESMRRSLTDWFAMTRLGHSAFHWLQAIMIG